MKKKEKDIVDQLREAVTESGLSINAIARGAGVQQSTLHRFAIDGTPLNIGAAALVASYFGMRLTAPKKPKRER